jgi:hypothetical protein
MAGFSGGWRNRALQPLGDVTLSHPEYSVRHMTDWDTGEHGITDDATGRLLISPDARVELPPDTVIDATDNYTVAASGGPVSQEDTSARGHGNQFMQFWSENNTVHDVVYPSPVHSVDKGDERANNSRAVQRMNEADVRFTSEDYKFDAPQDGSREALVTGAYGYPEMNPTVPIQQHTRTDPKRADSPGISWAGSPHVGTRRRKWIERKIPGGHGSWVHDDRPLYWHYAKIGADTPAGESQNVTPFADLVSSKLRVFSRPMLRRNPPPWDESATTDGSLQVVEANDYFSDF